MDIDSSKMDFFSSLLREGYDLRLRVTGNSMKPFLKTGSYVTLSRIPADKLRPGDIIFFRSADQTFKLHRLIEIGKKYLIAKGDALNLPDPEIDRNHYLGKVIRIENSGNKGAGILDMDLPGARIFNFLVAGYFRLKLYLIRIYIGFKTAA
jgi:SOS-response transcriptional repressor LexA